MIIASLSSPCNDIVSHPIRFLLCCCGSLLLWIRRWNVQQFCVHLCRKVQPRHPAGCRTPLNYKEKRDLFTDIVMCTHPREKNYSRKWSASPFYLCMREKGTHTNVFGFGFLKKQNKTKWRTGWKMSSTRYIFFLNANQKHGIDDGGLKHSYPSGWR
jgi:hypothetical protein